MPTQGEVRTQLAMQRLARDPVTDETAKRIAVALEAIAGCTGWLDEQGRRQHDDETCPVHEPPEPDRGE